MARINLRRRGTVYVLRVEIQPGLSLRKARGGRAILPLGRLVMVPSHRLVRRAMEYWCGVICINRAKVYKMARE